ncbi:CDP-glycerol glycerophosphotransferase family protein [Butyrivibrio sp. JL13D10]|uniref:CDP-glycerol glycerophosphotransferase family protein n=1 Tax=Butyrivibrio sp. JL13D10 TaxID=3236815 RepID=UPI0038B586A2
MKIRVSSLVRILEIYAMRSVIHILHVFKLKNNRIIFNSYRGEQYSCSPKYLSEYLNDKNEGWEIIWAFNHPYDYKWLKKWGITAVKYNSLKRFYYEATAYASINNVGSFSWIPLRKGQIHINTWHGGGCYKRVALGELKNDALFKKSLIMNSEETTHFLSSSRFFSEEIIPNEFGYFGKVVTSGLPRNDVFFDKKKVSSNRDKVIQAYGLKSDVFIVLYAPTWRYDGTTEIEHPDFEIIISEVVEKYGKECEIIIRPHPLSYLSCKGYIDASKYPDMQELLCAADMLITDYSSCIWDYALLLRPCILFIPDEDNYLANRGLYKNIKEWRIPIANSNEELINCIKNLSDKEMADAMKDHLDLLGSFENGKASETVYRILHNKY